MFYTWRNKYQRIVNLEQTRQCSKAKMIALFRYSFYEINVVFYRTYHVWVRTVRAPALDFQGVRVNFLRYSTGAVRTSSQHSPHARAVRSMVEH